MPICDYCVIVYLSTIYFAYTYKLPFEQGISNLISRADIVPTPFLAAQYFGFVYSPTAYFIHSATGYTSICSWFALTGVPVSIGDDIQNS
jgi:hypothetical protein